MTAPRCGKPIRLDGRYERSGEPGDPGNPPVCGRPEGHPRAANGSPECRSEAAVSRKYAAGNARIAAVRRARGRRYGRTGLAREAA
jgi:hypothetical protein